MTIPHMTYLSCIALWLLSASFVATAHADVDVDGAVNTLREAGYDVDAASYLASEQRRLAPQPVLNAAVERRLDCISWYESRHTPGAYNRSSGASGQFQFLPSTWRTTPQGRAGLSVFDPVAAREAARWMLGQGRAREWVPVLRGLC